MAVQYFGPSAIETSIAPLYDSTATYALDAKVMHNGLLYKCTTAIMVAESWTPAHWTATNVSTETRSLPVVDSLDNGKVLQVINGVWAAATIPSAEGGSF